MFSGFCNRRAAHRWRFITARLLLAGSVACTVWLLGLEPLEAQMDPNAPIASPTARSHARSYYGPEAARQAMRASSNDVFARAFIMERALKAIGDQRSGALVLSSSTGVSWRTNGRACVRVRPGNASGLWEVELRLLRSTADGPYKSGEIYAPLPSVVDASRQPWRLSGEIYVPRNLVGEGPEEYLTPMRARWVLRDAEGRRCFGPNTAVSLVPDRWVTVAPLAPTIDAPIPKGLMEEGFDLSSIVDIGFNVEAGNVPQGPEVTIPPRVEYNGTIQIRNLQFTAAAPVQPVALSLPPLYASEAEEAAAAPRLWTLLRRRLGLRPGEMAVMVNLAWPFRANNRQHVYGTSLGIAPWGEHWGFSSALTRASLVKDLQFLKAHGIRVVRVFLFGDLRTGLRYDAQGHPIGFSQYVYRDMAALLDICRREQMLLVPSLVDFLVADGVTREGPGLAWEVGEQPQLLTDPQARKAFVKLLAQFIKDFNGPDILMWELMNEPENAVSVATPRQFNSVRMFIRQLAHAAHARGIVTTLAARHLGDYRRFWRGTVDVPQVHHWQLLESVPNPYPVDTPAHELGPLPSMVGELDPVDPQAVGPLLDRLRTAGYLMAGFWSLRGHDGYAYAPIAAAVQAWIDAQKAPAAR